MAVQDKDKLVSLEDLKTAYDKLDGELDNKVDKETGKGLSTNDYTTADKNKLSGIEAQANKTVIDSTLTQTGQAADAKATGDAVSELRNTFTNVDQSVREFIENGAATGSGYYKQFAKIKSGETYILKVTAAASGTYTLAFGTSGSAADLVDTVYTGDFAAGVTKDISYTPTGNYTHARLWICDNWTIAVYQYPSIWDAMEEISESVAPTVEVINQAFDIIPHENLIDESAIIHDKYYLSGGSLTDASGWDTSGEIIVEANKTYYFSFATNGVRAAEVMWYVILFDSAGTTVLDYNSGGDRNYTPPYNGILHFTWKASETKSDFFLGQNSNPAYYDEYGIDYISKKAKELTPKRYADIKWACVGDSLTEVNSRTSKHYFDYIFDKTGINVVNMGVSGSGYRNKTDNNQSAFYQRIVNVPLDTDVVTIFGSFNDGLTDIGTEDDTGYTTVGGCVNATIDALYGVLPTVQLGIVSPTPWETLNPYDGTGDAYVELLEKVCLKRGIPFLNLYRCSGLRPWESAYRALCYSHDDGNGTHPDETGHAIMAPHFEAFLDTLLLH